MHAIKRNYTSFIFYAIITLTIFINIVYDIYYVNQQFNAGFLAIIMIVELPSIEKHVGIQLYKSICLSIIILSFLTGWYFLLMDNEFNAVVLFLVAFLTIFNNVYNKFFRN